MNITKELRLFILLILFKMPGLFAQNTFPPSGNVGIGTNTPNRPLSVVGDIQGSGMLGSGGAYYNVLHIPALENAPFYFYIDTNIPANAEAAPQIHITGYMYGAGNHAMKITIGWYYYMGNFYWSQYHSDIGYNKPARIRLGKYTKNSTEYIRIEVANNGVYWSNYTVSTTDRVDFSEFYKGWTYGEGEMPVTTSQVTVVPQADAVIDGKLGVGTATPAEKLSVEGNAIITGMITTSVNTGRPITLGPSGMTYTKGDAGGWAFGYHAKGSAGTDRGGFGFCGGVDDLYYYYIGQSYLNPAIMVSAGTNNIGIGTTNPGSYKLAVNGDVKIKKLVVTQTAWPDYVFASDYKLKPLKQVERFIKVNKHLPEMPSAKEVEERGLSIGDTQALLLKKMEEMTLYIIALNKKVMQLEKENKLMRKNTLHAKK